MRALLPTLLLSCLAFSGPAVAGDNTTAQPNSSRQVAAPAQASPSTLAKETTKAGQVPSASPQAGTPPAPAFHEEYDRRPHINEDEAPGTVERHAFQAPIFHGKLTDEQKLEKRSFAMFPRAAFDTKVNARREAWLADQEQQAIVNEINRTKPLIFPVSGR